MAFGHKSRNTDNESTGDSNGASNNASNSTSNSAGNNASNSYGSYVTDRMEVDEDKNKQDKKNPYYTWW